MCIDVNAMALHVSKSVCEAAEAAKNQVVQFGGHAWSVISSITGSTSAVAKDASAMRHAVVGTVATFELTKILFDLGTTKAAVRALNAVQNFISASRIFVSINHFISGEFVKDLVKGNLFTVVGDVYFLAGRIGAAVQWLASHGIVKLAAIDKALASIPVFGAVGVLGIAKLTDTAFLIGLAASLVDKVRFISKGEDVLWNIMDATNMVAEVAAISFSLAASANPYVVASLALFASATGIAAFLIEPKKPAVNDSAVPALCV